MVAGADDQQEVERFELCMSLNLVVPLTHLNGQRSVQDSKIPFSACWVYMYNCESL